VTEEEVALVVEQCRSQRGQDLDESLLEAPEAAYEESDEDGEFDPDEDPLLDKAIEIVVQTQTASVSLLQRRLRVGYTRAGRLIDMLERRGIISGYEGSKPRRRARLGSRPAYGLSPEKRVICCRCYGSLGTCEESQLAVSSSVQLGGRLIRKEGK
jgi:hypothetical protein